MAGNLGGAEGLDAGEQHTDGERIAARPAAAISGSAGVAGQATTGPQSAVRAPQH